MLVIVGLIVLLAAVTVGVIGVLTNAGAAHLLTDDFAVLGYHVTGSTGSLFLYGIVVGAVAGVGFSVLLTGARRAVNRGRDARRELQKCQQDTAPLAHHPDTQLKDHQHLGAAASAPANADEATTGAQPSAPATADEATTGAQPSAPATADEATTGAQPSAPATADEATTGAQPSAPATADEATTGAERFGLLGRWWRRLKERQHQIGAGPTSKTAPTKH